MVFLNGWDSGSLAWVSGSEAAMSLGHHRQSKRKSKLEKMCRESRNTNRTQEPRTRGLKLGCMREHEAEGFFLERDVKAIPVQTTFENYTATFNRPPR